MNKDVLLNLIKDALKAEEIGLNSSMDNTDDWDLVSNTMPYDYKDPIAFTYDWGLTTDTSRVNQAKLCGKLGVEHIIRAANIRQKRNYVRNIMLLY